MPQRIQNLMNGEWMWEDVFERRITMKRRAGLATGEWSGSDRAGRALTVAWVSSRWAPLVMLDVYTIYADEDY